MIDLSTKSLFFVCILIIAPFLLRYRSGYRKVIFLALNVLVVTVASRSLLQWVITAIWVLAPYVLMRAFGDKDRLKGVIIAGIVAVYVYLARYGFVFSLLHLPDIFLFRILGLSYFLFREISLIESPLS